MMKYFVILSVSFLLLVSCRGPKNNKDATAATTQQVPVAQAAPADTGQSLQGSWTLTYITGPRITFEGLYPERKPEISFDLQTKKAGGNTSCNNFTGPFTCDASALKFSEGMIMTKMACPGTGEPVFLDALSRVETYKVTGNTLELYLKDVPLMRFEKR